MTHKSTWAGMERRIAKQLGTTRQYGQSAKSFRTKDPSMLGDVKTGTFLIECKLRDYAPKGFRLKHPRKFYKHFRVQNAWWHNIKKEAIQANRIPVLVVKPKYGKEKDMVAIMTRGDLDKVENKVMMLSVAPGTETSNRVLKSSVKLVLDRDGLPWEFSIDDECIVALPFETFLKIEAAWRGSATE